MWKTPESREIRAFASGCTALKNCLKKEDKKTPFHLFTALWKTQNKLCGKVNISKGYFFFFLNPFEPFFNLF